MAGVTQRTRTLIALTGAVAVGILTAIQARINGQLGVQLDDGFAAAFVSFGSGLVVVSAISLFLPSGRKGFRALIAGVRDHSIPPWMLLGGVAGAVTVATQGVAVGIVGVSLFTVGVVAGQSVHGLVLDRIGFGPAGVVAVTVPRLLGGLLALAAVAVSLTGDALAGVPLWMLILPFAAGVGIAWQQAVNGRLRNRVGTPLTATLVNFIGGATCLFIAAVVSIVVRGRVPELPTEPWLYIGGTLGVVYIFVSAALVPITGVLLLGLGAVVGQLSASVIIDALWPTSMAQDAWHVTAMIVLAAASVIVATAPWSRRRKATSAS